MKDTKKNPISKSGNLIEMMGRRLEKLSRRKKRAILICIDAFIFAFALCVSIWLRLGQLSQPYLESLLPILAGIGIAGVVSCWLVGFYKTLMRAFDFRSVNTLLLGTLLATIGLVFLMAISSDIFVPRSVPIIFFLIAFVIVGASRILARWLYQYSLGVRSERVPVLIYGAGEAGNKVASILSGSTDFSLVGFLDDDETLRGNYMRGRRVYSLSDIDAVTHRYSSIRVLMSVLNITPTRKREIYERLNKAGIKIEVIPSLIDVVAGRVSIDNLRDVRIEDLLGRETVPPIETIFSKAIGESTILVSGGGGSIGSELCRQILYNKPKKLIVLELNEFALYQVERSMHEYIKNNGLAIETVFKLGNAENRLLVRRLLEEFEPDCVFHAAAYKHVPIVEDNILEGVRNNILSTEVIVSESQRAGIKRFTLISTDKAVRPTSVMGATKRISELVVQAHAAEKSETIFSMVRFGNVLGSSGSVIPVFKSQIENGGPITVTHRDVTRYFMTIPEAAQLVIQAAFLANGGEVFLLDMGEPVKIDYLARLTIQLSGFSVRDDENLSGDIAIKYIGLRPGEKLYEELLIGEDVAGTLHPKIMKANETFYKKPKMDQFLKTFKASVEENDPKRALNLLKQLTDL